MILATNKFGEEDQLSSFRQNIDIVDPRSHTKVDQFGRIKSIKIFILITFSLEHDEFDEDSDSDSVEVNF